MEKLNINLPITGDLHAFLHTNESCSDEEKKQITSLVSFVLRKCLAITILKSTYFFLLFYYFLKPCIYEKGNAINCLLIPFNYCCPSSFSPHLTKFVQCIACCNDMIFVASSFIF